MWALFEGSIQNVLLQKNLARLLGTSSFNPSKVCIPIHVSRFIFPIFLFWVKLWIGEILHHLALQKTNSLDPEARKARDFFFEKEMNLNQSFMALGSIYPGRLTAGTYKHQHNQPFFPRNMI